MTIYEVQELIEENRLSALLVKARALTGDSSRPALDPCIQWALRMLGYTVASLTTTAEAELAAVTTAHIDALLDLTELKMLEAIQTNLTEVDLTTGPVTEALSDLSDRLAKLVPIKRANIGLMYGKLMAIPFDPSTSLRKAKLVAI